MSHKHVYRHVPNPYVSFHSSAVTKQCFVIQSIPCYSSAEVKKRGHMCHIGMSTAIFLMFSNPLQWRCIALFSNQYVVIPHQKSALYMCLGTFDSPPPSSDQLQLNYNCTSAPFISWSLPSDLLFHEFPSMERSANKRNINVSFRWGWTLKTSYLKQSLLIKQDSDCSV